MDGIPKAILVATDLSHRCDRPLDRAVALGDLWQGQLVIVSAITGGGEPSHKADSPSWRRPADPLAFIRNTLSIDIGAAAQAATLVVQEGEPTEVILRAAEAHHCDLIVTGLARNELLGRVSLGATVNRLVRRSRVPVLIVKRRARQPYRRIVVATDFSICSRYALEVTAGFFAAQTLMIFHAYDPPMPGLTDTASSRREYRQVAEQDYESFLKSANVDTTVKQRAQLLIEFGPPSVLLREYVRDMDVDLVVAGTHGRSALAEVFIGSVAKQIVEWVPCDVLVVRESRATTERLN